MYRILLCSLLVMSAAASDKKIAEKDYNKLIASATELCKCTKTPITYHGTPDVCSENSTTKIYSKGLDSYSNVLLNKVCEDIKAIYNENKKPEVPTDITTKSIRNSDVTTSATTIESSSNTPTETTGSISVSTKYSDETTIQDLSTEPSANSTENSNVTTPRTIEPKLKTTTIKPISTKPTPTTVIAKTTIAPHPAVNHTTVAPSATSSNPPEQTSKTPETHSTPSPTYKNPTDEKKYALYVVLITFFCSFGAGILIAVASKLLYSRYRERTYEIPAEQELH